MLSKNEGRIEAARAATTTLTRPLRSAWTNALSHPRLRFAETIRKSPDPLKTLSIYEQRLSRRFNQTLKQLFEMQADRRTLEKEELNKLDHLAIDYSCRGASREAIDNIDPTELGFVCSLDTWQIHRRRELLPSSAPKTRKAA